MGGGSLGAGVEVGLSCGGRVACWLSWKAEFAVDRITGKVFVAASGDRTIGGPTRGRILRCCVEGSGNS